MDNDLRKNIKKTLIDLGLDRAGSYAVLLPHVEGELGRAIGIKSFSMAMSGYRSSAAYQEILAALQQVLATWADRAA
ncbi:MAG: hypothetical protein NT047_00685 [Deltaproteobacteria bacterium]|nr:hypothetical protein [Deltaproteobacteria bacterium]